MCIWRFAYAHCIYSIFDYEIRVRVCNSALHVVNVKAQVRDIGVSSLVFSFSSHRGGGAEARSSSAKLQNEKLREARRSKECEARGNNMRRL